MRSNTLKEKWIMKLRSVQHEEEESSETLLDTEAEYFTDEYGDRVISYEETEATGMEGSVTEIHVAPDGTVSIIRTGFFQTHLVMQMGKKYFCNYETPFGEFTVGVSAKKIRSHLTEDGGTLELHYIADANTTLLSDNEVYVELSRLNSPDDTEED